LIKKRTSKGLTAEKGGRATQKLDSEKSLGEGDVARGSEIVPRPGEGGVRSYQDRAGKVRAPSSRPGKEERWGGESSYATTKGKRGASASTGDSRRGQGKGFLFAAGQRSHEGPSNGPKGGTILRTGPQGKRKKTNCSQRTGG